MYPSQTIRRKLKKNLSEEAKNNLKKFPVSYKFKAMCNTSWNANVSCSKTIRNITPDYI